MDANSENIEIIHRRPKDISHNKTLNNPTKDNVLEHKTNIKYQIPDSEGGQNRPVIA